MSPDTRLMCGLSLLLIPTIVYGGVTILGVLTNGAFGGPGPRSLTPSQTALYRAGHAHAGVLTLLALFLQLAVDYSTIPHGLIWPVRVGAVVAALLVSGGFFGIAHLRALRALLYSGALVLVTVTLIVGVGLLRTQ